MTGQTRTQILSLATVALTSWVMLACVKGGSLTSGSSSTTASGSITLDKVYPTSSGSGWTAIIYANRYYIKGLNLTVTGTCGRGVNSIGASDTVAGAYTETASCDVNGNYTFQKTYTGSVDSDRTLTLTAYDVDGAALSGATKSVDLHIDNVVPPNPVINTPATGSTYAYNGSDSAMPMGGTCGGDTYQLIGPNSTVISCSGGTWTYTATLVPNSSLDFSFVSYDRAGNNSGTVTQTITWNPDVNLLAAGPKSGGFSGSTKVLDSGGSGITLETTISSYKGRSTSGTGETLDTGFNYISNSAGAP
jgi:hypothetical protein